ncbi:MAG: alpha-amylase [Anaerolineae bacterium]|nr:alpha-amylase [Anaerolineae bacterium]
MAHWINEAIFYHIYPLGCCGAPRRNDFSAVPQPRLDRLYHWLDHLHDLGINALYLGPLFEATAHGYDTADYFQVDRRLGTNQTLAGLSDALHERGIRLVLDGVFNHVGRDFWAFRDLLQRGSGSPYRDWFVAVRFGERSPYGDPFSYASWNGHAELVQLNTRHPDVRAHLFEAVGMWIDTFHIDGLRLDVADSLDLDFQQALAAFCRVRRPDFWLMGEVIHGDYRRWVNPQTLDSVTNYTCFKGLYSSLNDRNYFEIGYELNRLFGEQGLYRDLVLYAFADNHDVNRVASNLGDPRHLYPLYALLFTMPGVPSLYYGSEWGIAGRRDPWSDVALRPFLDPRDAACHSPYPQLALAIGRFARIRRRLPALRYGRYRQLHVSAEQFAFAREMPGSYVVVALNAAGTTASLEIPIPHAGERLVDVLNGEEAFAIRDGSVVIDPLYPCWARIMEVR